MMQRLDPVAAGQACPECGAGSAIVRASFKACDTPARVLRWNINATRVGKVVIGLADQEAEWSTTFTAQRDVTRSNNYVEQIAVLHLVLHSPTVPTETG